MRRARASVAASLIGCGALGAASLSRLMLGSLREAAVLLAGSLVFLLVPFLLRWTASLVVVGNVLAGIGFTMSFGFSLYTAGRYADGLFTLAASPVSAVLLAGWRWGVFWTVLTCAAVATVATIAHWDPAFLHQPDPGLAMRGHFLVAVIFAITILTVMLLYEWLKSATLGDLERSEARYRSLVESSPLGVVACDAAGRVTAINQRLLDIVALPGDRAPEATNLLTDRVLRESGISEHVLRCLAGAGPCHGEFSYRTAWGRDVEVRMSTAAIVGADGEIVGVEAIVEDVTEERRVQREERELELHLADAEKLKSIGVLAGRVAHDFNNLLTVIVGNAEIVLGLLGPEHRGYRKARQIDSSAAHASRLTSQLLAYAGRAPFATGSVALSRLVGELTELVEAGTPRRVAIERGLADDLPRIHADESGIRQVILNLVTNAVEAVDDAAGGTVVVTTGRVTLAEPGVGHLAEPLPAGEYVFVEVTDDGIGMDAETQRRIFDPFFTTKFLGRGLGLSSLIGIVRGHGGDVRLRSAPGEGTTFRVLFPASDDDTATAEVARAGGEGSVLRGRTVLVADDEAAVLATVEAMLSAEGVDVIAARGGDEAVARFTERADDVAAVLLDLVMPHGDGPAALAGIRAVRADAPVVIGSGYGEAAARERVGADADVRFVAKPYRASTLVAALTAAMRDATPGHGDP